MEICLLWCASTPADDFISCGRHSSCRALLAGWPTSQYWRVSNKSVCTVFVWATFSLLPIKLLRPVSSIVFLPNSSFCSICNGFIWLVCVFVRVFRVCLCFTRLAFSTGRMCLHLQFLCPGNSSTAFRTSFCYCRNALGY